MRAVAERGHRRRAARPTPRPAACRAPVLLIDGNSLVYRAFFALPTDLATASGQVTNAVFGFTSMLVNLLRDHKPDAIAVAFDRPEPTFRHERVDTYKANRRVGARHPPPADGPGPPGRRGARSIPILEVPGFEADDIIATLATQGRDRGDDVIIVTGDRDSYQLVEDPHVKVLYNKRGVSRLRALRRGRHRGAHRRHARRCTRSTPRCAATRPTTCPACPGWGRRRRPS